MQIKKPRIAPAVALIGRISPDAMINVLRTLDTLGAGVWRIHTVQLNARHPYFCVEYRPITRKGTWEAIFDLNGICMAD